jgi:ABC-type uncharacterized transport system permease subunit
MMSFITMSESYLPATSRVSFEAGSPTTQTFQKPIDCYPTLTGPTKLQRTFSAILGLVLLTAGPCLFLLNLDDRGWTWAAALITTWLGLILVLLLWNAGCRSI